MATDPDSGGSALPIRAALNESAATDFTQTPASPAAMAATDLPVGDETRITSNQTFTQTMFSKPGCEELKLRVFEEVNQAGSTHELTRVLLVSKEWNRIASPLLWENVLVTNDNILPVIRSLVSARLETTSQIRNLSIYLRPCAELCFGRDGFISRTILGLSSEKVIIRTSQNSYHVLVPDFLSFHTSSIPMHPSTNDVLEWNLLIIALRKLFALIKDDLSSLKCMSFRLATWADPEKCSYADSTDLTLPRQLLVTLLHSLPATCTSIELDDCGHSYNSPHSPSSDHLCTVLSSVLPRMKHAQIKVTDLCPEVVRGTESKFVAPKIEDLRINIRPTHSWRSPTQKECSMHVPENILGTWDGGPTENSLREQMLATALRTAFDNGSFPKISTLKLVNWHEDIYNEISHFSLVDVINKTTHLIPKLNITTGDQTTPEETVVALSPGHELYCIGWDREKIAESIVDDGWFTTTDNLRFPIAVQNPKLMKVDLLKYTTPETTLFGYGRRSDSSDSGLNPQISSNLAGDDEDMEGGYDSYSNEIDYGSYGVSGETCDNNVNFHLEHLRKFQPMVVNNFDWTTNLRI
ncbi:hypothetical protein BDV96DRAFT_653100 [Lophiotrema nucula]|uniref:F-box domain-containing protein n=1 Tax=Lophiotrema nucula TaxID=690887 RepID=A0A6A5YMB0_9PLEO|nr:hypothetical protein BDV96DRAFT_653100 [Lophiotrema nucula]